MNALKKLKKCQKTKNKYIIQENKVFKKKISYLIIMSSNRKTYHAIAVDKIHFFYLCPYDKKECPQLVHFHGSCGNYTDNRIENRSSHCSGDQNSDCCSNIDVSLMKIH